MFQSLYEHALYTDHYLRGGFTDEESKLREVKQLILVSLAHDSMLLLVNRITTHAFFHSCPLYSKGIPDF